MKLWFKRERERKVKENNKKIPQSTKQANRKSNLIKRSLVRISLGQTNYFSC